MIPVVEGTRPWGPSRKRVPKCLKGPKTTYTTIAVAEKQSKRSKRDPFSLHIGTTPRSHPGNGINGARRGRSLPIHPGFFSHGLTHGLFPSLVFAPSFDSRIRRAAFTRRGVTRKRDSPASDTRVTDCRVGMVDPGRRRFPGAEGKTVPVICHRIPCCRYTGSVTGY